MKKFKHIIPNLTVALFAIFIAVIGVFNWFTNESILYYWDTLLPFSSSYSLAFLRPWYSGIFPGFSGAGWSWLIYVFSISGLEKLFSSLSLAQSLTYLGLIFFSIINFYLLISKLSLNVFKTNNTRIYIIAFIFSVMYALNLYTFYYAYFLFNPEAYILAFLPLNILALILIFPLNVEKNKRTKLWIILFFLSLVLMSPGFTTLIFFIQYIGWVFLYLVFYFLISEEKLSTKFLKISLFFSLVILANWWWFSPAYLSLHSSYESARFSLDPTTFIEPNSKGGNLLNSLRLIGSTMMNNNPFSWFSFYMDKNPFNFVLFFFPFLILFLIYRIKTLISKNILLFLLTMFAVSLFIVKLGNPPLADLTYFAFRHIPFFDAFRDAQHKAGLYYVFSYFVLSFVGFCLLINYLNDKKKALLKYLSFFILVLGFVIVTGPFFLFRNDNIKKIDYEFNGKKYIFSAKTQIPKEYYDLKDVLEKGCAGRTTIVIPRGTAITNAVWEKYGTSYIGQDILSHFVNCNLISAKISENDPDAFTTAPYLLLQNNDFNSFKNYLLQNDISLVLIRKDNIPFYYTSWFHVDPKTAINFIEKDFSFQKVYENDFFNLYKLGEGRSDSFGFNLSQNIIYTNSLLSTAVDYSIVSKSLSSSSGNLIINKNDKFKKYSGSVSQYVSVGNCIGCVQISNEALLGISTQDSWVRKIKDFLKKYLKFLNKPESIDTQISKNLINSNKEFGKIPQLIKDEKLDELKPVVESYAKYISKAVSLLKQYNGAFFDRNQKFLETNNYLAAQNISLSNILSGMLSQRKNTEMRTLLNILLIFQNQSIGYIDKNIWQTDKENMIYRVRLDIASENDYSCKINSLTEGVYPTGAYLDGESKQSINEVYHFKKGSYPISIDYKTLSAINLPKIGISSEKEIGLGKLPNGSYTLSFNIGEVTKPLFVLVTNKKIDLNNNIKSLSDALSHSLMHDYFIPGSTVEDIYKKDFNLDSFSKDDYFLYLVIPSAYNKNVNKEVVTNLSIGKNLDENGLIFYCSSFYINKEPKEKVKVTKVSNVEYDILLPDKTESKFLLFNQSFNTDWWASSDGKSTLPHFSNGYANAWDISNVKGTKIKILFLKQNTATNNIILSVILFTILLVIFIKFYKKNG